MKRVRKKKKYVSVKVGGVAPTAESLSDLLRDLHVIADTPYSMGGYTN